MILTDILLNSIILLLFIPHEKSAMRIQRKKKYFLNFFFKITALLKFMRDAAEKNMCVPYGH